MLKTKYFIGGNYEIEVDAEGNQRKLHYLSASTGLFAIFVQDNEDENMYYIHKDHLGSFQSITNEDGELVEKLSFDPCSVTPGFGELANPNPLVELIPAEERSREGRRRNPDDWSFNNVPTSFTFDRGYTGHQHLDNFDLINMNGRVYDPFVARFLSPDPFIQNPSSTQNFNRYSYVSNNPLKFTDPSGYTNHPMSAAANNYICYEAWGILSEAYSGPLTSGSGNHWSDQHRSEFGNFMLMNSSTFDNTYSEGAFDKAVALYDFGGVLTKSWAAGETSLADVTLMNLEWNALGGDEVKRDAYTKDGGSYLDIYYEGAWTLQKNQNAATNQLFGGIDTQNGGGVDATPYVGGALGVGSEIMFSDKFGTWMGKDGKIRSQNWGGNGTTGGKYKFAGKAGKFLKWGGSAIGVYGIYDTYTQYDNNEIDGTHLIIEQISNVIGFIPTYGTAWSIGWNLGQDFGPSTWYGTNDYKLFE